MLEAGSLPALPSTQRDILRCLKFNGELRTEELARMVFITPGAVRHHLALLSRAGYVRHREEVDGRGRPRFDYSLTPEGDELFPTAYRDLALALLEGLQRLQPELLKEVLLLAADDRLAATGIPADAGPWERLEALRQRLDAEGFMPVVRSEGGPGCLTLHHCPILAAAKAEPALCRAERDYVERALGHPVDLVAWRIEGATLCRYAWAERGEGRAAP